MTTYIGLLLWFVALCQTFGCLFDADLTNHQIRNKNCIVTLFSDFEKRCVIGKKAACTYSSRRKARVLHTALDVRLECFDRV
jgi:hypothetical protein